MHDLVACMIIILCNSGLSDVTQKEWSVLAAVNSGIHVWNGGTQHAWNADTNTRGI